MDINDYYAELVAVTGDTTKPAQQRIEEAFELKEQRKPAQEVEAARFDSLTYAVLTVMLDKENEDHGHDTEILQLLTLNAEAMVEGKIERSLKGYSRQVDPLIGSDVIPFDVKLTAIDRIADALGDSVYNHDRYSILDHFIRYAAKVADSLGDEERKTVAGLAQQLYRLDNLLSIHGTDDDALLKFISVDDMLKIREKPQEGLLKRDRIEYTRRWEDIYYDVCDELDEYFADTPRHMGFCFRYWQAKEELLARKYGFLWRNPHLMNPGVMFD